MAHDYLLCEQRSFCVNVQSMTFPRCMLYQSDAKTAEPTVIKQATLKKVLLKSVVTLAKCCVCRSHVRITHNSGQWSYPERSRDKTMISDSFASYNLPEVCA